MIAAYATIFAFLSLRKYFHYLYTDFDLAIFAQAVDRLRHGSTWNSIRGMDWRGDHSSLILYPLAPLTWAFPPAPALLVLQSLALGLGALPVYRMARRAANDEWTAMVCAALYLLYPAVGYTNLFEFHPEALCVPLLLASLDGLLAGRPRPTLGFAALALLGKEDMALAVLGIAACALLVRRPPAWRLAGALATLAVCSLAVTFLWLRPAYGHGEVDYAEMYSAWGRTPGQMALGLLRHPLQALAAFVSTPGNAADTAGKLQLYAHLLLPLGLLPVLAPLPLLGALPALAQHLLSSRPTEHTIVYHYTAALTPFLFASAVLALARLRAMPHGRAKARFGASLALVLSLVSNAIFGPVFGRRAFQVYAASEPLAADERGGTLEPARDRMVARVPPKEGVVASFEFLARLAARENLESFHHVYQGHYTLSPKPYPMPRDVRALLSAVGNQWDEGGAGRVRALIASNDLHPVDAAGDLVLFLRGARDTVPLLDPAPPAPGDSLRIVFDGQLAFVGAELPRPRVARGGSLEIRTDWRRVASGDRVFLTLWSLIDASGHVALYTTRYLGYGLATPDRWPEGRVMRDTYRLPIPARLVPGRYTLVMEIANRVGGGGGMARVGDPRLAAAGGMLQLGIVEVEDSAAR
jgi:uncharacterized membrane protein